jgi:diguanylate cyclase (GGDEF)-like protein
VVVYLLVRRGMLLPWIGWLTTALDVSMVSLALAAFLPLGAPHTAVNSKVIFEVYFLAIGATCLRYDRRLPWFAGALAVAQYGAIVWYAATRWELNAPRWAPFAYGMFDWTAQVSRGILLLIASALSGEIVSRGMRLRQLSSVDRLTGLLNRGFFDERADEELSRARRYGRPLALAVMDADHFKSFNDTYGHAAGDTALRTIAAALRSGVRRSDVVARYGGEEFVLLFPETTADEAAERLDAIRERIEADGVALPRHAGPVRLTISGGVAGWPEDGDALDRILYRADSRLFAAKRQGRNRVIGSGVHATMSFSVRTGQPADTTPEAGAP